MTITILTIFPAQLRSLAEGWSGQGEELRLDILDIRDLVPGSFRAVDDSPYGGGAGMILRCEPVFEALKVLGVLDGEGQRIEGKSTKVIALSPSGKVFDTGMAQRLGGYDHLILICGHYEGLDERIYHYCDETVSIGDFVLSGGELAAMTIVDAVAAARNGR